MHKKPVLIAFILCSLTKLLSAQVNNVVLLTKKPLLYERTDFDISLISTWDNPYLQEDVALDMTFITPSGKTLILPCFYDSGESGRLSLWKARFAPQEKGRYTYQVQLSKNGKVISSTKPARFTSYPSNNDGFLHAKNDWVLQFDDGKPFRGLGEDIAWESRAHDDSKFFKALNENPKYNYQYMLGSLAKHGGNFFRTWITPFNLPIDWKKPFNSNRYTPSEKYFNPSAIAKMDRLVYLCDSLHLHMMLTLGGGAYLIRDGGFSPNSADFFVNPRSKQRYKNRLRYFIARWGYSPGIAAWELFNEVDNVQFRNKDKPISADSIVQWHEEMSTYIKHTDPYGHLVTTSISHRDIKGLNSLPDIDFNQKHIYRNTAGIPRAIKQYEQKSGKPYVIGEYAYEWDWSKNFNDFAGNMDSDFKRGLWYGLFSPTPILPMSWWWEYFDNRKTDTYLLRVRTILDQMLAAGNGNFEAVKVQAADTAIIAYGVKCNNKLFVYAFNPGPDAKTLSLSLAVPFKKYGLTAYDCETGSFKKMHRQNLRTGHPEIANWPLAAKTDVIFILTRIVR